MRKIISIDFKKGSIASDSIARFANELSVYKYTVVKEPNHDTYPNNVLFKAIDVSENGLTFERLLTTNQSETSLFVVRDRSGSIVAQGIIIFDNYYGGDRMGVKFLIGEGNFTKLTDVYTIIFEK